MLNVKEFSKKVNLSTVTVYRLLAAKEIPFHAVGRKKFFTEGDVEGFYEATAIPAKCKPGLVCTTADMS